MIRKTWEQVSHPEPLWEIYHEPWNRVSGLYAAISTLEPWELGKGKSQRQTL